MSDDIELMTVDELVTLVDQVGDALATGGTESAEQGSQETATPPSPPPSVATDEPVTVHVVMTARSPRWIGPPITEGTYLFAPGVPLPVQPADVAPLTEHTGLAELGVTFAVAGTDAAAPAVAAPPAKRRKQRG